MGKSEISLRGEEARAKKDMGVRKRAEIVKGVGEKVRILRFRITLELRNQVAAVQKGEKCEVKRKGKNGSQSRVDRSASMSKRSGCYLRDRREAVP